MYIYDKELDVVVGMSPEDLKEKMGKRGLLFSKELAEAYRDKSVRLTIKAKHLQKMLDKLDVHHETSLLKTDIGNVGDRIHEIAGEIEYLSSVCMGLTDISALFINHAFSLGIKPTRVYFANLSQHFHKATHGKELLAQIEEQISQIKNTEDYKYISAMNNYAKHNNVICTVLEFCFKPVRFAGIISCFTHNKTSYPKTRVTDFIEKIRNIQLKLYDIYFTLSNGK